MRQTRRNTQIGLRDLAREAGVSMMTVSRAMRGIDGVAPATRDRIAAIADRLGYVPNGNARALVQSDSRLIGISLPNLFNDVFADILAGMRRSLHQAGYSSLIDTTDYDPARELDWVQRMAVWRPAALVLTGCHPLAATRARLGAGPVVVMQIWDVTADPIDTCVGIDHAQAGEDLGRHVAGLGYRRPAFIGAPEGLDPRADARVRGLARAFAGVAAAGLTRIGIEAGSAFAQGARGVPVALADPRPDVLFFHNDNGAFGGLAAAEGAGLRVPEDIGIVGFNGLEIARVMPRPLTTMETPRRQIGLVAANRLLARLNGLRPAPVTALPCRLIAGATTQAQG